MNLSKFFTIVTPFSKILATVLFITIPFAGFYLGMEYQKGIAPAVLDQSYQKPLKLSIPSPVSDPTANWKTFENKSHLYQIKYPLDFQLGLCSQANCVNPEDQLTIKNNQVDIGIEYARQWSLCANYTLPCYQVNNINIAFPNMKSELETYYSEDRNKYLYRIFPQHPNNDQIDIFGEFPNLEDANTINQILSTFKFLDSPSQEMIDKLKECDSCPLLAYPRCPDGQKAVRRQIINKSRQCYCNGFDCR